MLPNALIAEQQVKLIVAYDGSYFKGWQDNHKDLTIEAVLRKEIETIQRHPIELQAASRTDAGVHAEGQVVTFKTPHLKKHPSQFLLSLNFLLPRSIRILDVSFVDAHFHPSIDALSKEYHYWICYDRMILPRFQNTTWHTPGNIDSNLMEKGAVLLTGTHDFKAFSNNKIKCYENTVRTIYKIEINYFEKMIQIKIVGSSFLYKMVRNIVGSLVYLSRGKIAFSTFEKLIYNCSRKEAGMTAPAQGLTLHKVNY